MKNVNLFKLRAASQHYISHDKRHILPLRVQSCAKQLWIQFIDKYETP